MCLNPPLPDPCTKQIGYPLENGKIEPTIFWNLPCMALPPGGVAVQVGFRRLVDCCHSTLYSGHEHRGLARLASPQLSPHFESGICFIFFPPSDGRITKRPPFPNVPRGFLFPVGLFPSILLSSSYLLLSWSSSPIIFVEYNSKYQPLGQPEIHSSLPNLHHHGCRSVFPPWGVYHPGSTAEC